MIRVIIFTNNKVALPVTGVGTYNRERKSAAAFLRPALYPKSMLNSWRASAHLANFALFGAASVYESGLWSENTIIFDRKIHDLNFLKDQMTAKASLSLVDHLDWVGESLRLAKAIGRSLPWSSHWIKQQPTTVALASTSKPKSFV